MLLMLCLLAALLPVLVRRRWLKVVPGDQSPVLHLPSAHSRLLSDACLR